MDNIIWHGESGLILGLEPRPSLDAGRTLPESVEAQVATLVSNLETLLIQNGGASPWIIGMRFNLTQFKRFHKRAVRALGKTPYSLPPLAVSWIGVTDLPSDALVTLDVWLHRDT